LNRAWAAIPDQEVGEEGPFSCRSLLSPGPKRQKFRPELQIVPSQLELKAFRLNEKGEERFNRAVLIKTGKRWRF